MRYNGQPAIGIVLVVLAATMGLRMAAIIGLSGLVFAILGTFILMAVWGIDLQRVSLGALIIAMGMMVDNAIVVADDTECAVCGADIMLLRRGSRLLGHRWQADGLSRAYLDLLGIRTRLVGKIDLSVGTDPLVQLRTGCCPDKHQQGKKYPLYNAKLTQYQTVHKVIHGWLPETGRSAGCGDLILHTSATRQAQQTTQSDAGFGTNELRCFNEASLSQVRQEP
jgi:hypothetical protein